ncbi:lactoylglutathione lyase (Glyoxalase family) CMGI-7 [Burkholderia pseudomallei MSHR684]|nr:lactoylglutathione lyase (Glyoxalase family) CMGI-7 [Burkholderia pseudomallei MSHR684]
MKRFHVHVSVANLADSIRFYSALFAAEPTVVKEDYAKWMLEDPRVNFAISQRGAAPGLDHLGVQTEDDAELAEMRARLDHAALPVDAQIGAGVLLCALRQILERRSARHRMGGVPDARRSPDLRRVARGAGDRAERRRAGLLRPRARPAGRRADAIRLLLTTGRQATSGAHR